MQKKMLFFDYREHEKKFFENFQCDNYDIEFFERPLNEDTINQISKEDFDNTMAISVFITSDITKEIINKFKNLRIIATRSTGYDHIDIRYCAEKNIAVVNVANYGSSSVAQFTLTLIMMLIRNLQIFLKNGNKYYTGHNINNLTLGVVGTGAIGTNLCLLASCIGFNVLAYDIRQNQNLCNLEKVQYTEFDYLLENSDIISLHIPYNFNNYHMISSKQFDLMKEGSYLVNVARGELVDSKELLKYLENGKIKGAALDVVACDLDGETDREKSSLACPNVSQTIKQLSQMDNVIITPHIAYDTQESIDYILENTFKGISDCIQGGFNHRVV